MVLSRELRECSNVPVVSIPDEYERKVIYEFEMDFKKSFCKCSNQSK